MIKRTMGKFDADNEPEEKLLLPPVRTSELVALLQKRAPRLAAGLIVGRSAWPAVNWARAKVRSARTFTVRVPGNPGDALYEELHARILEQIPEDKRRALVATAADRSRPVMDEFGNMIDSTRAAAVKLRYDGSRGQQIIIDGHKVKVEVTDGQSAGGTARGGYQPYKPPEIVFTVQAWRARDAIQARGAVLAWVDDAYEQTRSRSRKPSFWMFNQWDEWERVEEISARSPESVILPEGQMERIIEDIRVFLESEAEYLRRCTL